MTFCSFVIESFKHTKDEMISSRHEVTEFCFVFLESDEMLKIHMETNLWLQSQISSSGCWENIAWWWSHPQADYMIHVCMSVQCTLFSHIWFSFFERVSDITALHTCETLDQHEKKTHKTRKLKVALHLFLILTHIGLRWWVQA